MGFGAKLRRGFSSKAKTTATNIKNSILSSKIWKKATKVLLTIRKNWVLCTVVSLTSVALFNVYWFTASAMGVSGETPHFYCNSVTKDQYPLLFEKYCKDYEASYVLSFLGPIDGIAMGHASSPENGGINGTPGDQTGNEVCVIPYYDWDWYYLIRAKDATTREKIAECMIKICQNNNIGYGQNDDLTAFRNSTNADPSTVTKPSNTDCAKAVGWCLVYAGLMKSGDYCPFYTGNQLWWIQNHCGDKVEILTKDKVTELKKGDILLTKEKGHTAVIVQEAEESDGTTPVNPIDSEYLGN